MVFTATRELDQDARQDGQIQCLRCPSNIAGRCGCGPAGGTWTARSTSALTLGAGSRRLNTGRGDEPQVAETSWPRPRRRGQQDVSVVDALDAVELQNVQPECAEPRGGRDPDSSPSARPWQAAMTAGIWRIHPVSSGIRGSPVVAAEGADEQFDLAGATEQGRSRDSRIRCRRASVPQRPG